MASQLLAEEASKGGDLNSPSADGQQVPAAADDSTPGYCQVTPKKKGRKRKAERTERQGEDDEKKGASSLDRPSRERKSVERYMAMSSNRVSATKALEILQGSGEKLKDIPNVAFKLSKRKADESLRVLHKILFGRKGNVHFLKRDILQFSGFVWSQNEEKDRSKVKEKLNKCNKDRLLDLSELLDIYTLKVNTKKEDISARLMEFLESPHVTREVLLSEKAKKRKKRKRGLKRTGKRQLDEASADKEQKREIIRHREPAKDDEQDKDKINSIDRDDESADEDEGIDAEETSENSKSIEEDEENKHNPELAEKISDEEEMDGLEELEPKQHIPSARKASSITSRKSSSSSKMMVDKKGLSSSEKRFDTEGEPNVSSERKTDSSKDTQGSSKMKDKVPIKTDMEEGKKKDLSIVPTTEQLFAVVSEILKKVDFNVATLADIIRQLGTHFDTDLMDRKVEIKRVLEDVINSMTDDEDADEEGEKN